MNSAEGADGGGGGGGEGGCDGDGDTVFPDEDDDVAESPFVVHQPWSQPAPSRVTHPPSGAHADMHACPGCFRIIKTN